MTGTLSPIQVAILHAFADLRPHWTLTGGGALAGFHLAHRTTREVGACCDALRDARFDVEILQRSRAFARLQVRQGDDATVVDLVAEPVAAAEQPTKRSIEGVEVQVDTRHEILVNKLGALLHRAELRDLVDLRALLTAGGEFDRAMRDAAAKDGGFSALTLGWMLASFPLRRPAVAEGWDEPRIAELEAFRADLALRTAAIARP